MNEAQWREGSIKTIAIFLNGEAIDTVNHRGERILDDSFFMLFNTDSKVLEFVIPPELRQWEWRMIIDTTKPRFIRRGQHYHNQQTIRVEGRSFVMLKRLGRLNGDDEE
jgi:isoamylase